MGQHESRQTTLPVGLPQDKEEKKRERKSRARKFLARRTNSAQKSRTHRSLSPQRLQRKRAASTESVNNERVAELHDNDKDKGVETDDDDGVFSDAMDNWGNRPGSNRSKNFVLNVSAAGGSNKDRAASCGEPWLHSEIGRMSLVPCEQSQQRQVFDESSDPYATVHGMIVSILDEALDKYVRYLTDNNLERLPVDSCSETKDDIIENCELPLTTTSDMHATDDAYFKLSSKLVKEAIEAALHIVKSSDVQSVLKCNKTTSTDDIKVVRSVSLESVFNRIGEPVEYRQRCFVRLFSYDQSNHVQSETRMKTVTFSLDKTPPAVNQESKLVSASVPLSSCIEDNLPTITDSKLLPHSRFGYYKGFELLQWLCASINNEENYRALGMDKNVLKVILTQCFSFLLAGGILKRVKSKSDIGDTLFDLNDLYCWNDLFAKSTLSKSLSDSNLSTIGRVHYSDHPIQDHSNFVQQHSQPLTGQQVRSVSQDDQIVTCKHYTDAYAQSDQCGTTEMSVQTDEVMSINIPSSVAGKYRRVLFVIMFALHAYSLSISYWKTSKLMLLMPNELLIIVCSQSSSRQQWRLS